MALIAFVLFVLAGLSAARRLHADGVAFQLHEARPRLGRRILTVDASGEAPGVGFDAARPESRRTRTAPPGLRPLSIGASVRQLVMLFGSDAGAPLATLFKDWAADALTATDDDLTAGAHPQADDRPWVDGEWGNWLNLAGAVHAAERAAATVKRRIERR